MGTSDFIKRGLTMAIGFLAMASTSAGAVVLTWTDWTSITSTSAIGNMGGVVINVTATNGFIDGQSQTGPGTGTGINYWTEPNPANRPYTGGTVFNAPTPNEQVGLNSAVTINVSFSAPVQNLYMALLSVGSASNPVTYTFSNQAFTLESEGQGYWGSDANGGELAGNAITGREFHGLLRFSTTVTELSFTTAQNENWHAFTFGANCIPVDCCEAGADACNDIPEPGTLALLSIALLGIGATYRRSRRLGLSLS